MPDTNEYSKQRNPSLPLAYLLTTHLQHTHTHAYTELQVNHNVLIRLGVFVLAQNTTGTNKGVRHLFIMLHLEVCARVFVFVCVTP